MFLANLSIVYTMWTVISSAKRAEKLEEALNGYDPSMVGSQVASTTKAGLVGSSDDVAIIANQNSAVAPSPVRSTSGGIGKAKSMKSDMT